MSISAFTGLPGAGKSYAAVQRVIIPALESRRCVWTNVPLRLDVLRRDCPSGQVSVFKTADLSADASFFDRVPPGAVLVLDECWQVWPSGLKMSDAPLSAKLFLSQHRHRVGADGKSTEVVLLTQDLSQLAAFVRSLIEQTVIVTKLSALGSASKSRVDIYQGAVTGRVGPKSQLLSSSYLQISQKVYQYYQSHMLSVTGVAGDEKRVDRRGVIWRSPFFLVGVLFVFAAAGFGGLRVWRTFSGRDSIVAVKVKPATVSSPASLPVTVVHSARPLSLSPGPKYSAQWRLGGFVKFADGSGFAVVTFTDGTPRYISLRLCHLVKSELSWECTVDGEIVTDWSGQPRPADTVQPVPTLIEPTQVPIQSRSSSSSGL